MSNFTAFKLAVQRQLAVMTAGNDYLFVTDVNKDLLWETYLDSFPVGTNEIFKERREFDCQCCKAFVRKMGNIVAIKDNKLVSIWDGEVEAPFNEVAKAMAKFVKKGAKVSDAFLTDSIKVGTDKNHQMLEGGDVHTWEHFYVELRPVFVRNDEDSIASTLGNIRDTRNVFKRSLDELSLDAAQTVLELIDQGSLYRGEEFRVAVGAFHATKLRYNKVPMPQQGLWCWINSRSSMSSRIRNTAIGTLLINLSDGMDLDAAVGKFEAVVAPTNYKRPKAIFTKRMIESAQKEIEALGYMESLGRKYAKLDDISISNVLYINRHAKKSTDNVFEEMASETPVSPKSFSRLEEVSIGDFIKNIVPTATSIQVMVENNHMGNLSTLIAPKDGSAPSMLKWDNNFSWSYHGDIADSMKKHVKAAGGKVDGVLRFSIQWNDGDNNRNDFDAHCIEPGGNLISYRNKSDHRSTGRLDVDITRPGRKVAVENITWTDLVKMRDGQYQFLVHNFSHNGGTTGFTAEIEYNGEIYSYTYDKELRDNEKVLVADIIFSKLDGITFTKSLSSTLTQKELWGIKTNSFVEVAALMHSPNYWDGQEGVGNKHYFFFLNGCMNPGNPRGFYNEFLRENLLEHKRVFEALGSKMRVEHSNDQLSGLGFSTTQRNSVIVKVEGAFTRTIKVNF